MAPADLLFFNRAIMPSLQPMVKVPCEEATFRWIKEPENPCPCGTTYMDGSLLHNHFKLEGLAARSGWAVATFSDDGVVLAAAHGKPPEWADGIHAAELWALLMSTQVADVQNKLHTDCMAVLNGTKQGQAWANSAARKFGRAWGPVSAALEGDTEKLAWMPAHCSPHHVGVKALSDGSRLSRVDLRANALVDMWAKQAAASQCLSVAERRRITDAGVQLTAVAKWIGLCGVTANHFPLGAAGGGTKVEYARDADTVPRRKLTKHASTPATPAKRKRQPSPTPSVLGDLSACPRWAALRARVLSRVA